MIFFLLFVILILFYVPSYIFFRKTSKDVLEVKKGKYYNVDLLCLFILLIVSTFISVLEISWSVSISAFFRRIYDILVSLVLLICMVRRFYYTLYENYNRLRVFIWPILMFIVFVYMFICFIVDVNLSVWLGFNKFMFASLDIFTWYYICLAFIYLLAMFVIPIVCYKNRKKAI